MWNRDDLIYFAGFFDGEGSIIIYKRNGKVMPSGQTMPHNLRVCLSNTDRAIMKWVHATFGGLMRETAPYGNNARAWKWTLQTRAAGILLDAMVPFLRVKRAEARVALRFQHNVTAWKVNGHQKGVRGQLPVPPRLLEFRDRCADRLREIRAKRIAS